MTYDMLLETLNPNSLTHSLTVINAAVAERTCCGRADCYSLADCKLAYSDRCTSTPVNCAVGTQVIEIDRYFNIDSFFLSFFEAIKNAQK